MSYNQPGPYGGQPPQGQPGPYGQQPGPYGQQPGPYGGPPRRVLRRASPATATRSRPPRASRRSSSPRRATATRRASSRARTASSRPPRRTAASRRTPACLRSRAPPKKKTGLIVGAAVVALAVVAGGVYFFTSGGGSGNGDVADATKGYKLTPAASVDDYKKDTSGSSAKTGPVTGKDKAEAEAMGIKNPQQAGAKYLSGDVNKNPLTAKMLILTGMWGEIDDPAKALDNAFASAERWVAKENNSEVSLVDSPKAVEPAGFKGALMKCQSLKTVNKEADGIWQKGPKEFLTPVCIWSDYSTVGVVVGVDIGAALTNKSMSQDEVAALAAKLYNTSRTKV